MATHPGYTSNTWLGRFSPPSESQWMSPNIRPNNIYLKKTQTCLSKFIDLLIHYSAPHLYISCLCAYLCDAFIYLSITLCIYVQSLKPFLSVQVFIFIHLYLFIFMYTPHSHSTESRPPPASGRPTTLALAPSSSTDLSSSSACLVPQIQRQGDACKIV